MEPIKSIEYFHLNYKNEEEKKAAVMKEASEFCKGNRLPNYEAEKSIKEYLYSCVLNLVNKNLQSA